MQRINKVFTSHIEFEVELSNGSPNTQVAASFKKNTPIPPGWLQNFILSGKCKNLSKLDLTGVRFGGFFYELEEAFKRINADPSNRLLPQQFTLSLSGLDLNANDAKVLSILFSKFDELDLNLTENKIGNEGAVHFINELDALENKQAHRMTLQLGNNGLTTPALEATKNMMVGVLQEKNDRGEHKYTNLKWEIYLGNKNNVKNNKNRYDDFDLNSFFVMHGGAQGVKTLFDRENGHPPFINLSNAGELTLQITACIKGESIEKQKKELNAEEENVEEKAEKSHFQYLKDEQNKAKKAKARLELLKKLEQLKGYHVVMQRQGMPADSLAYRENTPVQFDDNNSSIFSTRDYQHFGLNVPDNHPTPSNDKLVIGYSLQGLPFQVIVSAKVDDDQREKLFKCVDDDILKLVSICAGDLSRTETPANQLIEKLCQAVDQILKSAFPDANYGLSAVITYEAYGRLYGVSIGLGDAPGIVYVSSLNKSWAQWVYDASLSVLKLQTKATMQVVPDDVLLGYHSLCDELQLELEFNEGMRALHPKTFEEATADNLYEKIKNEDLKNRDLMRLSKMQTKGVLDAHSIMGAVRVPSADSQRFISEYVMLESLQAYVFNKEIELKESDLEKSQQYYKLNKHIKHLLKKTDALRATADAETLNELTDHLHAVNCAIQDPNEETVSALFERADMAQGSPSPVLQAIGVVMILLGGVLAAIGGVIIAAAFSAALAGLFPVAVPSLGVGTALASSGGALLLAGIGFFAGGGHRIGLSKAMDHVAHITEKHDYNPLVP